MKVFFSRQFIIWAIVGITTISLDFMIFILSHSVTHAVALSNFISISCSSVFNFMLHRLITFQNAIKFKLQLAKYSIYQIAVWAVGTKLILLFVYFGASIEIAKLLPLLVIAPINYLSLKNWVYK